MTPVEGAQQPDEVPDLMANLRKSLERLPAPLQSVRDTVAALLADSPPARYEEDDYAAGRQHALAEVLEVLDAADALDGWVPTRWWQVTAPDGSVWCRTSDEDEARRAVRTGDQLAREYMRDQRKLVVVEA